MYHLDVAPHIDKIFLKLKKKDSATYFQLKKKIHEIRTDPYHYKPLRGEFHGAYRVHIRSSVLIFEIDESQMSVRVIGFDHHDRIYR